MDQLLFRSTLGRFTTGVCVVTTVDRSGQAIGLTVNSFASLSLDPPLVLWSLGVDSDTFAEFSACDAFAVNVLRSDQREQSIRFSQRGQHALHRDEQARGSSGCPVLSDALAVIECRVAARHEGGDHVIQVGAVQDMRFDGDGEPLVYFAGAYRELA
jgi:flavin reductase (DIM6/NTAB) family NADH-FMN oxidoreductase RutF